MTPRPFITFVAISVGTNDRHRAADGLARVDGELTQMESLLAPIAMGAPPIGRVTPPSVRSIHGFTGNAASWPLGNHPRTQVLLVPRDAVHGTVWPTPSRGVVGFAQWSPGGRQPGKPDRRSPQTSSSISRSSRSHRNTDGDGRRDRVARVFQPRLDGAGLRSSVIVVWLVSGRVSRAAHDRSRTTRKPAVWRRAWRLFADWQSPDLFHHGAGVVSGTGASGRRSSSTVFTTRSRSGCSRSSSPSPTISHGSEEKQAFFPWLATSCSVRPCSSGCVCAAPHGRHSQVRR